jgi:SNF2 family DNA or RNA helicase
MDTFSRFPLDTLLAFGFKHVIIDEAHGFKNASSKRAQQLIAFLHNIEQATLEQEWTFTCPFLHTTDDISYKELGIAPIASPEMIKAAYRGLARRVHPDVGGTAEEFKRINEAYLAIKDKETFDDGKVSWTETVKIDVSATTGIKSTSKTSKCPKCGAMVSQSAMIHQELKRKCTITFLTGTPIKNRADEFFVPLNILMPDYFSSLSGFRSQWLMQDAGGKYSRVQPRRLESFKTLLKPVMLRREKEDVYKDLPAINRTFSIVKIEDENLKKAYNTVLDRLEAKLDSLTYFNSIGELTLLRQICGLAKVDSAVDYTEEILENVENAKIAIGLHHHSVKGALKERLKDYGVDSLDGTDNAYQKDRVMREFQTNKNRVLAINMLAGGVGMDFHYVDNVLILERQWSSADEEQFEFRFYNPDKSIKNRSTNIEYQIAQGTIDEYFYNIVEEKRAIFGATLGTQWSLSQDGGSFKKLLESTIQGRL